MTRRCVVTVLIVLAGLLAAQAGVRAGVTLPFYTEIRYTGGETSPEWEATCAAMEYDGGFEATRKGQATHLGRVTTAEKGCNLYRDYPVIHSIGWMKITAANGDVLNVVLQADFDFSQEKPPATGAFRIDGGTGRFANAVGRGAIRNIPTLNPGEIMILEGWITYEASDGGNK
jgi:hypothetical protein